MKHFISIVLAFFILGSNLGFSFGVHYCGKRVAESKILFSNYDLGCGMEANIKKCDDTNTPLVSKVPCCKDEIKSLQLEEETELNAQQIKSQNQIKSYPKSGNTFFIKECKELVYNDLSIPDKPKQNRHVLFQSFLI